MGMAGRGGGGEAADPAALLERAKRGDADARERLIREYTPFVLRVCSRATRRFIRLGEDDEASVGLIAFNQAIDAYDPREGPFLAFAQTLIRRRLVDHYRRERKHASAREPLEAADGAGLAAAGRLAAEEYSRQTEAWERREEIQRLKEALAGFGLTFAQLVRASPRHRDARERAQAAARTLVLRRELWNYTLAHRALPLQSLEEASGVGRKTLERYRRYIIAVALILSGDFPCLGEYVGGAGVGAEGRGQG
ncbi:MAG: RNA polymerase sigma-I factor [Acetobacteraceae bacterium]|nr:RNA polymerase sigma-I factor [Acetobacteraceae bacterium]